jgi:hypothetical protein
MKSGNSRTFLWFVFTLPAYWKNKFIKKLVKKKKGMGRLPSCHVAIGPPQTFIGKECSS